MRFDNDKHYNQPPVTIRAQYSHLPDTEFRLGHWVQHDAVQSTLMIANGAFRANIDSTSAECRALAKALLAHADSLDEHLAEFAQHNAEAACPA